MASGIMILIIIVFTEFFEGSCWPDLFARSKQLEAEFILKIETGPTGLQTALSVSYMQ